MREKQQNSDSGSSRGRLLPFPLTRVAEQPAEVALLTGHLRPVLEGEEIVVRLRDGFVMRKHAPCDGFLVLEDTDLNSAAGIFIAESELRAALAAAG